MPAYDITRNRGLGACASLSGRWAPGVGSLSKASPRGLGNVCQTARAFHLDDARCRPSRRSRHRGHMMQTRPHHPGISGSSPISEPSRLSFWSGVRPRRVDLSRPTVWRIVSRRALRCGQPVCVGQGRRRRGLGERPCMQRRFLAAFCRLPGQGPDPPASASCACQPVFRLQRAGAPVVAVELRLVLPWTAFWLRTFSFPACPRCNAQARARSPPVR